MFSKAKYRGIDKKPKKTVMLESTIYNKQQLHEPIFWQL
jgi:hypothetical protein